MKDCLDDITSKKSLLEVAEGAITKLKLEQQGMREDQEKLRQRISQLRQNRTNVSNILSKFCKNCKREYQEKDNLNWSCRVHRSEWGGDIWWCCGKTTKGAPGKTWQLT